MQHVSDLPSRLQKRIRKWMDEDEPILWCQEPVFMTSDQWRASCLKAFFLVCICMGIAGGLLFLSFRIHNGKVWFHAIAFVFLAWSVYWVSTPFTERKAHELCAILVTPRQVLKILVLNFQSHIQRLEFHQIQLIERVEFGKGNGKLVIRCHPDIKVEAAKLTSSVMNERIRFDQDILIEHLDVPRELETLIRQQMHQRDQICAGDKQYVSNTVSAVDDQSSSLEHRLFAELLPDEQLVWTHAPENPYVHPMTPAKRIGGVVQIVIGAGFLFFLFLQIISGVSSDWMDATKLLLLGGIGLIVFYSGLQKIFRDRDTRQLDLKTVYAITDKRVIIGHSVDKVDMWISFLPEQLGNMTVNEHKDGLGSLIFMQMKESLRFSIPYGLLGIEKPFEGADLIHQTFGSKIVIE